MPCINLRIDSTLGPILEVIVMPSKPRQDAMKAAGLDLPEPCKGTFLVDTGANGTCIDPKIINRLGIPASGLTHIRTPSTGAGTHQCNLYDVMLFIPGNEPGKGAWIQAIPAIESDFSAQGIDGLLGRDVLNRFMLVYNGTDQSFSIAH